MLSLVFRRTGRQAGRELVRLEVTLETGAAALTALVDTGHSLTDAATNRPVVVAEAQALAELLPGWADASQPVQSLERCHAAGSRQARLVPYRAVGVEHGLLLALRSQGVKADGRNLARCWWRCPPPRWTTAERIMR